LASLSGVRLLQGAGRLGNARKAKKVPGTGLRDVTAITGADDRHHIDRAWARAKLLRGRIMNEPLFVREWGAEAFHERVLELETKGYIARLETYQITAETNPDTGEIIHLHTIEMLGRPPGSPSDS
jgi:hypothetical protein